MKKLERISIPVPHEINGRARLGDRFRCEFYFNVGFADGGKFQLEPDFSDIKRASLSFGGVGVEITRLPTKKRQTPLITGTLTGEIVDFENNSKVNDNRMVILGEVAISN